MRDASLLYYSSMAVTVEIVLECFIYLTSGTLIFSANWINEKNRCLQFSCYASTFHATLVGFPACQLFWSPSPTVMDGANFIAGSLLLADSNPVPALSLSV